MKSNLEYDLDNITNTIEEALELLQESMERIADIEYALYLESLGESE